jgi:5'/3'-nucleotidase
MNLKTRRVRPSILVSNDDGIDAPGIAALARALRNVGTVIIVAPDKQQSAVGHAITMNFPLRVRQVRKNGSLFGYAVDGTPADAVKLAVRALLKRKPDLLVSGINHGSNTAISVLYSGTVSAATEGTILGIPSIAVSLTTFRAADFSFAGRFSAKLARQVLKHGLPKGTLLNVNIPPLGERDIRGVLITRQGESTWEDLFEARRDPANKEYYWLTGVLTETDNERDVDQWAVSHRYISVTPLQYDLTDYAMIDVMKQWGIERRRTLRPKNSKNRRRR